MLEKNWNRNEKREYSTDMSNEDLVDKDVNQSYGYLVT